MLAGLAAAAAVLASCAGDASAARPAEAVFSSSRDGTLEIYAADTATLLVRRLTSVEGADTSPAMSPNRRHIAFISDRNGARGLWVMDASGQSERIAFPGQSGDVAAFFWAPDSRRISYQVVTPEGSDIYIGDVNTSETAAVPLSTRDVQLGGWSPDNNWFLYSALSGPAAGVHRKTPEGVDDVRLTTGADSNARWSPDGRLIAFTRTVSGGTLDLAVVSRDGKSEKVLLRNGRNEGSLAWSPSGEQIAFVSDRDGDPEIYVIRPDGKGLARLTDNQESDLDPRWSRDGRTVLFVSNTDGDFDLFTMRPDGTRQSRVVDTVADEMSPDW